MDSRVREALDSAAGADRPWNVGPERTATDQASALLRRRIVRFLSDLPEDMTVLEIREAIEAEGHADG